MSSQLTHAPLAQRPVATSKEVADAMAAANFSDCSATVVGYGNMGKHYVKALRALGVKRLRVCSRSAGPLEELQGSSDVETHSGGVERLERRPQPDELGIIATPTASLVLAVERLASLGYRRLLIEKPVSLWSSAIERLAKTLDQHGIEAACAYNRLAYPSFLEAKARAAREGGITSCTYTFTEMIASDWTDYFPAEELARWGVANSLHVIGMAHGLIGMPAQWSGHQAGSIAWHPSGAVFVGSGMSDHGVPFSYHADWGSTGRWSVEIHTEVASYRLCPLERLARRLSAKADWVEVPLTTFAPDVKAGLAEQLAAMFDRDIRALVSLASLREATALTRYAEGLFGYPQDASESPPPGDERG